MIFFYRQNYFLLTLNHPPSSILFVKKIFSRILPCRMNNNETTRKYSDFDESPLSTSNLFFSRRQQVSRAVQLEIIRNIYTILRTSGRISLSFFFLISTTNNRMEGEEDGDVKHVKHQAGIAHLFPSPPPSWK